MTRRGGLGSHNEGRCDTLSIAVPPSDPALAGTRASDVPSPGAVAANDCSKPASPAPVRARDAVDERQRANAPVSYTLVPSAFEAARGRQQRRSFDRETAGP
jgi:hypothetical protein